MTDFTILSTLLNALPDAKPAAPEPLPETALEDVIETQPEQAVRITLSPFYHSALNAIIEPDKFVPCSRYFLRRWSPLLGGVGVQIVLTLRSLGYNNRKTGERRDGIEIELAELAGLIGVHRATLLRELGSTKGTLTNPALHLFVKREKQYWREPVTNRLLRTANIYRIAMDDPLHEEDLPRLNALLSEMEKGQKSSKSQNATQPPKSRQQTRVSESQNATSSVQLATRSVQNATSDVQNATALKSSSLERNLNTSEDASSPPAPGGGLGETEGSSGQQQGLKKFDRAYWETQDTKFAQDKCRAKGWQWRGHLPEEAKETDG
jgi:hypothetical protein